VKIERHTTKVFAKAGLDIVTSAMCYYQQQFGLDVQCSAFVFILQYYIFKWAFVRAGRAMNSLLSQILNI
jgi:hypothetical protein